MKYDAFIGGDYEAQAWTADCERTINWYPEVLESPGATSRLALYPSPGVTLLDSTPGVGRAHFFENDREFAIVSQYLYEISRVWDGTNYRTNRGTVATDGNPATICSNGAPGGQLFITSGNRAYIYTLSTDVLTEVAALRFKATMGAYLDGYFVCMDGPNSTLYLSALLDGTSWTTGTFFAKRNLASDPWRAMKVVGRYLWLFGETTTEVWQDTGKYPFPLEPVPQGLIPFGIVAPFSACALGRDLCWLGTAGGGRICVLRASEGTPEVISTRPLEAKFQTYRDVDREQAIGDVYASRGHTFYVLHFDGQTSWAWDADTRIWTERATWQDGQWVAWRPRYHVLAFGESRMLDAKAGGLYRLDPDGGTDVGSEPIRRLRRCPAIEVENRRVYYSTFELDLEPGLGTTVTPGENPQVMMRMSNDAAKTWGPEHWTSAGKLGEYSTRVRWNRLGCGRRRVFEVTMTDPVPWRITGAYLQFAQQAGA